MLDCSTSGESGEEFAWLDEDGRRLHGSNDGFWGGTHFARDSGPGAVVEHEAYVFISGERDPDNDTMEVRAYRRVRRIEPVVKFTFPHESVRRLKTVGEAYGANGVAVHDGLIVVAFTHQDKLIFADARRKSVLGEVPIPSPRVLSIDRQGRLHLISGAKVKTVLGDAGPGPPGRRIDHRRRGPLRSLAGRSLRTKGPFTSPTGDRATRSRHSRRRASL